MRTYIIATKQPVKIETYKTGFTIVFSDVNKTYSAIKETAPGLASKVDTIILPEEIKLYVSTVISVSVEKVVTEDGLYTHIKITY